MEVLLPYFGKKYDINVDELRTACLANYPDEPARQKASDLEEPLVAAASKSPKLPIQAGGGTADGVFAIKLAVTP